MPHAPNNPKHGDNIIEETKDTFGSIKHVASFQFQKFLDSLGTLLRLTPTTFVVAAYGGIEQTGAPAMADIDSTFQTIAFDAAALTNPKGVTQDFANDALIFDFQGIWRVTALLTISWNDANSGRELEVRFFNADTATAGPSTTYFAGRNQDGINIPVSFLAEIPEDVVGDKFELQIGSVTDTFTGVTLEDANYDTNHVSEFVGDFT